MFQIWLPWTHIASHDSSEKLIQDTWKNAVDWDGNFSIKINKNRWLDDRELRAEQNQSETKWIYCKQKSQVVEQELYYFAGCKR